MKNGTPKNRLILLVILIFIFGFQAIATNNPIRISLSCKADNDLYVILKENKIACDRYNTPEEAIVNAGQGSGVLILADGYPRHTTSMDAALYDKAGDKKLRLYIEYPSYLPGFELGTPRGTQWERAVISSEVFSPALQKLRILAVHDCRFVTLKTEKPDIVIARIAGFDNAVYGLPKECWPILAKIPQPDGKGELMIATTKLSQFMTARYAPTEAWQAIWEYIFRWLQPDRKTGELKWSPNVRPSYSEKAKLPADVERIALERGINWFYNANLLLHPSMMNKYNQPANLPLPASANPDLSQDWPFGHRTAGMMKNVPSGDGSLGVLEGFDSKIFSDGTQAVRWWRRGDCNGEVAGAMGIAGMNLQNLKYTETAGKIGDWLFGKSMISLGDRTNPEHPSYGLFGWNDTPKYAGPGYGDGYAVYYGDDNARLMLGMMVAAAALRTDRYDERILMGLLGNLRVSGEFGFQPDRIDQKQLEKTGWKNYFTAKNISYAPHYQAYIWACYLWAYHHTGYELFLKRAKSALEMTMAAYPDKWKWTNGIQQERAKILLPLAWLIRVDDTPQHREWLRIIARDLLTNQTSCGAIREQIGEPGKGGFPPPASNEAYGTSEAPLIQTNDDGACDLLYTSNFAFLGLHEAAAATGEKLYFEAGDKLAKFLCRIQIRSEKQPELDGGWFRAFDFKRWEYWASNADAGWGAWSVETGWTQSWITSVLSLRQMKTSIWDITEASGIKKYFTEKRSQMIPDETPMNLRIANMNEDNTGVLPINRDRLSGN
jgi:hypothetical protein